MAYEELYDKIKDLKDKNYNELLSKVKDFAILHGLGMRSKDNLSENSIEIAPFTLFPSPLRRDCFQNAIKIQKEINALYHRLAYDQHFLQNALASTIENDEFTRRLYEIYTIVRKEGMAQTLSLGLFRSDYIQHSDGTLKQVEMNTIASSMGGITPSVELTHKFVLSELDLDSHLDHLPDNSGLSKLAFGILEAWRLFNIKSSVILIVVEDVTYNISDQRNLEFEIQRIYSGAKIIRRTFKDLVKEVHLNDNMDLYVGDYLVGVVYYRCGYSPDQYIEEFWTQRLTIERSKAIKCPSIQYHLVGTKKVQQYLCEENILEKYCPDLETAQLIRQFFVDMFPLDRSQLGEKGYNIALNEPENYVLKPQREGGGNNIYGQDIPSAIKDMSRDEACGYILMRLIEAPYFTNVLIKPSSVNKIETVSEVGFYGTIIGDDKVIFHNNFAGHMLRSKSTKSNESGVISGAGYLSSPYLV